LQRALDFLCWKERIELVQPAVRAELPEPETYTPERLAEFLLNCAVDEQDYAELRELVYREFGLDPDSIPHDPPARRG
jgi:hypothetical protein